MVASTEGRAESFTRVGRYLLSPPIASGGMATVHIARPVSTDGLARTVAVKRLHPHLARDADVATMFRDEARLSMRIQHPNVAAVLDVVDLNGELLLVMEYVAGTSLARVIQHLAKTGKRLPFAATSCILAGALAGLHAAHEATDERGEPLGVIHRDFSPHNILIGPDGVARVTDFGVAKSKGRLRTTQDGLVRGKLGYMSPEQIRAGELSRRADIFAAGVVLWEMLVGEPLFVGEAEADIMYKVLEAPIPRAHEKAPDVPFALAAVAEQALERDPLERFATAREMARALERAAPPAGATSVGTLVESLVREELQHRSQLVLALEQASSRPDAASVAAPSPPRVDTSTPTVAAPMAPAPSVMNVSFHDEEQAKAMRARVEEAMLGAAAPVEIVRPAQARAPEEEGGSIVAPLIALIVVGSVVGLAALHWDVLAPVVDAPGTAPYAFRCELDDAPSCHDLGTRYESGEGAPLDRLRATSLYQRACELGSSDGCIGLARMMEVEEGEGILARRIELLEKACDAGSQIGCTTLGKTLITEGSEEQRARGVTLMESACGAYVLEGCTGLGVFYLEGKVLPRDLAKAAALCKKSCERQDKLACSCAAKVTQQSR